MSVFITSVNGRPNASNVVEYLCETAEDILLLPKYGIRGSVGDPDDDINDPCAIGSTAFVCNGTEAWILAPSNEWIKL